MSATVLGLDIGTSAVKAVLVDGRGVAVAEASAPVATSRPRPLWSEQDPEDWWRAVEAAVADLARAAPDAWRGVAAIGLSGQMHGAVLLGADDRPLRPVILWNDGRAHAECAALTRDHPGLAAIVGVKPMPGFTAPKLAWLARHEPGVFAAIRCVLLPKDYVRLKLSGLRATDMSDAAGSWLLDEARRAWSPQAAAAVGLDPATLPALVEGSEPAGTLRAAVAERWGLAPGIPLAGGAGDAAAGAVGIGAVAPGDAFVSLGTSGQLFAVTDGYRPAPDSMVHAFAHALPGLWYQMGAMLTGASALAWAAGLLGRTPAGLASEAEAVPEGASDLLFLPYLTGERTPHDDPDARGVLFGLEPGSDAGRVGRAVMEGVAYTFADAAAALRSAGTEPAAFGFVGGGARSDFWARLLAAVLARPMIRYRGADKGPAFGAAALARMALTGASPGDIARKPPVETVFEPDPRLIDRHAPRVERFRTLYRALAPEFKAARA
ncbi:xylulokinase [Prosthecomicrobium sp. N25]|uniref:xylulokinase n=1 Tax=Prosthecomicrobium sp. N25 TaxID=3129254 RepID=UPI00307692D8